ncbi:hypothetical protein ACP26L_04375 [Paenibacillus sp. S-38]|uniref:hypothetical protein n=1 Tax=Paenibacillus sp. S-38 TaxID=3416710 RepID=UPI003CEBF209
MAQEHTVYFNIHRHKQVTRLRGLIFLEEGQTPTAADYEQCLRHAGHTVTLVDPQRMIFRAFKAGEEYTIDVLEDYEAPTRDAHAEKLAGTFRKPDPFL